MATAIYGRDGPAIRCLTVTEFIKARDAIRSDWAKGARKTFGPGTSRKGLIADLSMFRLIACCGIRPQEARQITLQDCVLTGEAPVVHVRPEVAKLNKERFVPAYWDHDTLEDLTAIKQQWLDMGHAEDSPMIPPSVGDKVYIITQGALWDRWNAKMAKLFCSCPPDPKRHLSGYKHGLSCRVRVIGYPYAGRHTFASIACAAGKSLVEIRDAMGHANLNTTSKYLHANLTSPEVGTLFELGNL